MEAHPRYQNQEGLNTSISLVSLAHITTEKRLLVSARSLLQSEQQILTLLVFCLSMCLLHCVIISRKKSN